MPAVIPALSVLVRPSRMHRVLLGAGGLTHAAAAALIVADSAHYLGAPALALAPALAAAILLGAAACRLKTHQIDISGTGEVRVTVQQDLGATDGGMRRKPDGEPRRLLSVVVFRPLLMVLRFGAPDGGMHAMLVWRDAIDGASWRRLAVALAAIGAQGGAGRMYEKIR